MTVLQPLLAVCFLAMVDCAGSQPTAQSDGQPVAPGDAALAPNVFQHAKAAFDAGNDAEAKRGFADFLLKYPQRAEAPQARKYFAQAALKLGDARDAVEALRPAISGSSRAASAQPVADRKELLAILQQAAIQAGDSATLVEVLGERLDLANSADEKQKLEADILLAIDHDVPLAALTRLVDQVRSGGGPLAFAYETLLMKLARVARHVGDNDRARKAADELLQRSPNGRYAAPAKALLAELDQRTQVKANAVGVILPLSGSLKEFGRTSLEAIRLALQGSDVELIVRDSENDADKAQAAVDDLAGVQHVIAILGPLFSGESLAAAVRAETYGVPMINLSKREGIPQVGPNIFRLCLTTQQQAKAIVKLGMDTLGYKRFALLYPNMSVGLEAANSFWDEVEARGGEIRGAETYDHDQTTFTTPVKKLVGRYWIDARSDYAKAVNDIRKNHALTQMQRQHQIEAATKSLPPITDFDAIFIPDNAKEVGYIAPALAFEDIIVSTDAEELRRIAKTTGRDDIKPVRLLGGNGWNSPHTAERGGKFVEGAIFVDGFFLNDPEPRVQRFVKLFRDTLRSDPSLPDAQAFDAGGILAQGLAQHPLDRAALARFLAGLKDYLGVTGKISFDKDGEAQHDLYILTIERGQIVKYESKGSG